MFYVTEPNIQPATSLLQMFPNGTSCLSLTKKDNEFTLDYILKMNLKKRYSSISFYLQYWPVYEHGQFRYI